MAPDRHGDAVPACSPARARPTEEALRSDDAPGALLFATDPVRAAAGLAGWPLSVRLAKLAPRAEGRPVLVLPGLLAGDLSTRPLRAFLRRTGSHVHGWRLGRNLGPTPEVVDGLRALVESLVERHGQPIAVVGWSLGGIYARAIAATEPDAVSQVITLGTPFVLDHPGQTRAQKAYDRHAHRHVPELGLPVPPEVRGPLAVPTTSIWSKQDGIVSWRTSLETPSATAENIAVMGSHLGLGHHPGVLYAVADRLSQAPGTWAPFQPPAVLRGLYRPVPRSAGQVRRLPTGTPLAAVLEAR